MENERVKALEKLAMDLLAEIEAQNMVLAVLIRSHADRETLQTRWTASLPGLVDHAMEKPRFQHVERFRQRLLQALGYWTQHFEADP